MQLPEPQPGLVIRYAYLWHSEAADGAKEAAKDRPCAIILSTEEKDGETVVAVAPITRTAPPNLQNGVEIPVTTKKRLGLDEDRSWIIVSEINRFVWPGPDLRPIETRDGRDWAYGFLPAKIFRQIQAAIYRNVTRSAVGLVPRKD